LEHIAHSFRGNASRLAPREKEHRRRYNEGYGGRVDGSRKERPGGRTLRGEGCDLVFYAIFNMEHGGGCARTKLSRKNLSAIEQPGNPGRGRGRGRGEEVGCGGVCGWGLGTKRRDLNFFRTPRPRSLSFLGSPARCFDGLARARTSTCNGRRMGGWGEDGRGRDGPAGFRKRAQNAPRRIRRRDPGGQLYLEHALRRTAGRRP